MKKHIILLLMTLLVTTALLFQNCAETPHAFTINPQSLFSSDEELNAEGVTPMPLPGVVVHPGSEKNSCASISNNRYCSGTKRLASATFANTSHGQEQCKSLCEATAGTSCCGYIEHSYDASKVLCYAMGDSEEVSYDSSKSPGAQDTHNPYTVVTSTRACLPPGHIRAIPHPEPRSPWEGKINQLCLTGPSTLNAQKYLAINTKVKSLYCEPKGITNDMECARSHYIEYGRFEETRAMDHEMYNIRNKFSRIDYLLKNYDVALSGVKIFPHFQSCGRAEGRDFVVNGSTPAAPPPPINTMACPQPGSNLKVVNSVALINDVPSNKTSNKTIWSFAFTTTSSVDFRGAVSATRKVNAGGKTLVITECPGQILKPVDSSYCAQSSSEVASVSILSNPSGKLNARGWCVLKPNTKYYANVINGYRDPEGGIIPSDCSNCGFKLQIPNELTSK